MERILVTGALGQLGMELVPELQKIFGMENIISSDVHHQSNHALVGEFLLLDVLDQKAIQKVVDQYNITQIYHLAAILSAKAESSPQMAWKINMEGLINVLEVARLSKISKIYWPSSIAVFGPDAPKESTPQNTALNPNTIYGVTKVAGEKMCYYYYKKYDMDIRSLRYPGLIGHKSLPGGGTTDYAVEIFHAAIRHQRFVSPLRSDTRLPMMYMDDAIRATIELMESPAEEITVRTSYNLAGINFTPQELGASISKAIPGFVLEYNPDFRQSIASSWPDSIDDSAAVKDWKWQVAYDLDRMSKEMIYHLKELDLVKSS